ncbi:hypothetical protein KC329_g10 [Hortaea werneckii]|nr:hypothetical protein KC329_g10 [Hortaea werneckii]
MRLGTGRDGCRHSLGIGRRSGMGTIDALAAMLESERAVPYRPSGREYKVASPERERLARDRSSSVMPGVTAANAELAKAMKAAALAYMVVVVMRSRVADLINRSATRGSSVARPVSLIAVKRACRSRERKRRQACQGEEERG